MSQADLDALRPTLLAISATDVDDTDVPVAVVVQEAITLAELLKDSAVRSRLLAKGLPPSILDALAPATGALSTAQAQWANTRDATKAAAQDDLEQRGYALRKKIMAAGRFNLRADRKAIATLEAINDGTGVADLSQDLVDLAELLSSNEAKFAGDTTFDAAAHAREASATAEAIRAAVAVSKTSTAQDDSVALRNRAHTYLDDLIANIREAGRYAYLDDPVMLARFGSEYLRRRRARQRKTTPLPPVPPT